MCAREHEHEQDVTHLGLYYSTQLIRGSTVIFYRPVGGGKPCKNPTRRRNQGPVELVDKMCSYHAAERSIFSLEEGNVTLDGIMVHACNMWSSTKKERGTWARMLHNAQSEWCKTFN